MSVIDRVVRGLRRIPRGFPADGRQLGLGLAAALDAQRARGAEPLHPETRTGSAGLGTRSGVTRSAR